MKHKRMFIIGVIFGMLVLTAGGAAAAGGLLRWTSLGAGRVVEMIPLEDGSAAIIQSLPNQREFQLYYLGPDGDVRGQRYSVAWNSAQEPDLLVRTCGQTVHIALTSESGVTSLITWQLPIEVQRVYLPVVCR